MLNQCVKMVFFIDLKNTNVGRIDLAAIDFATTIVLVEVAFALSDPQDGIGLKAILGALVDNLVIDIGRHGIHWAFD